MAEAHPASTFVGFDYHEPSVLHARAAAKEAGVSDRVRFEVATAKDFPTAGYDLIAVFDCVNDMGDPVGTAAHVRSALAADSASTFICTPASRSQEVGPCLGARSGEARMAKVVTDGGFGRFRRVAETPFNLIYEAKP